MTETYYNAACPSPLGTLTLQSDGAALTGLWLEGQRYFGGARFAAGQEIIWLDSPARQPVLAQTEAWLNRYFAGEAPGPTLPLAPRGTPFQKAVWLLLGKIPYGETTSYSALAAAMEQQTGRRVSARPVGGAVGRNPISILMPCHRVVGKDGRLTGYAGGLERKSWLLQWEQAHAGSDKPK